LFCRSEGSTFIEQLNIPYGTSLFNTGEESARRWVEITKS
jgi:hypothetical protein